MGEGSTRPPDDLPSPSEHHPPDLDATPNHSELQPLLANEHSPSNAAAAAAAPATPAAAPSAEDASAVPCADGEDSPPRYDGDSSSGFDPEKDEHAHQPDFAKTEVERGHPPPKRIRFRPKCLLYFGVCVESLFLVATGMLLMVLNEVQYAWYHALSAIPRIPLWWWIGAHLTERSEVDPSCCCNKFVWTLDTLMLMGMLVMVTFATMQAENVVADHGLRDPWHIIYPVAGLTNAFVILAESFMFRTVALLYNFSKSEYMVFKGVQLLNCVLVMIFGVMHALSGHKRACSVLYIFTILIWRREMFAALSRLDSSNKFVGIAAGYALLGNKKWYTRDGELADVLPDMPSIPELVDPAHSCCPTD